MIKILTRILIILLAAGLVTAALFAVVDQVSPGSPGGEWGSERPSTVVKPGEEAKTDGQPQAAPGERGGDRGTEKGAHQSRSSLVTGLSGIGRSLGVIAGITLIVALIQHLYHRITRRARKTAPA